MAVLLATVPMPGWNIMYKTHRTILSVQLNQSFTLYKLKLSLLMSFATSVDAWLIASAWLAANSFGLNMSTFGVASFWTIPLGYVVTVFHHGYLFRDLRRDPSLPIRRVYKFLFPCMIIIWLAGAVTTIFSAFYVYEIGYIRGGVMPRGMVGIAQAMAGGIALIEVGVVIALWIKCAKFKSNVSRAKSIESFDHAGAKV
ncbi:hypothetical protein B0J17DRAFT_765459 [Rhizoctonia solani]|nr:hypothetical protein B0J17DRAFT_765459 [Rhizoctonia solani]